MRVNFVLWFIASFNVAAGGFFVFLIFGTSKGVMSPWADLVLCTATGGRKRLSTLTTTSSGTNSNSVGVLKKIVDMPLHSFHPTDMTRSLSGDEGEEEESEEDSATEEEDSSSESLPEAATSTNVE